MSDDMRPQDSEELTYFASQAVHDLFQEAKPEGEFILELRSVKNKEGQTRSIWHLDGKNLWQYQSQDSVQSPPKQSQPEKVVDPTPVTASLPVDNWRIGVEERLDKLEKALYSKTVETDDDIPF